MSNERERCVILSKEELRTLAKLIHLQEEERIKSIPFRSEWDRCHYLRCCREAHDMTVGLLDDKAGLSSAPNKAKAKAKAKTTKAAESEPEPKPVEEVVQKYLSYLELAVGFGMQTVKNVHLRKDFLSKVRGHADSLIPRMNELRDGSLDEWEVAQKAEALIEELSVFKDAMYRSIIKQADPSSQSFSRAIKLSGNSYEEMISKYHKTLIQKDSEYDKQFDFLEDAQKIEVFDEVIQQSGRGSYLMNKAYKVADKLGKGLLVFTLGMSLWDIYSSEHKLQTIATEAAEFGAGWEGGALGEIAGAGIAGYLVTVVGIEATAVTAAFIGLTAFVTGLGFGIALAALAGYVVTKIFESGGKHTGGAISIKKDEHKKPPVVPIHHFQVYSAPMPDGPLLARQIAYNPANGK